MSMETIHAKDVADGQPPLSSVEVVSIVISPDSSNSTFFKNAGIATASSKIPSARGQALHQQLATEKQGVATLHEMYVDLRKMSRGSHGEKMTV